MELNKSPKQILARIWNSFRIRIKVGPPTSPLLSQLYSCPDTKCIVRFHTGKAHRPQSSPPMETTFILITTQGWGLTSIRFFESVWYEYTSARSQLVNQTFAVCKALRVSTKGSRSKKNHSEILERTNFLRIPRITECWVISNFSVQL